MKEAKIVINREIIKREFDTEYRMTNLMTKIKHQTSNIKHQTSNIKHQTSNS